MPYLLESRNPGPRRKKNRRGPLLLLALLLAGGLGGFLWWASHRAPESILVQPKPTAPSPTVVIPKPEPQPQPKPVPPPSLVVPSNPPPTIAIIHPPTPTLPTNPPPVIPSPVRSENPAETEFHERPVQNILEAQLALARLGISSGSLDGALGGQTRAALRAFQQSRKLTPTGTLDSATRQALTLTDPPYTTYTVTSNDLARLQPLAHDWIGKSRQNILDYENILELVAEKFWSHPGFIKRLNPAINWTNVAPNTVVTVPNVDRPGVHEHAAFIQIRLTDRTLEAFGSESNLLLHFPCSIAQRVEKRPVGQLHVAVVAHNPTYVFDPDNFPESADAQAVGHKLTIPAGPNNPVGTEWLGLDKPGYGIHGTPRPEEVGRTESHGCFRLANWNAELLARFVLNGTVVEVVP